MTNMTRSQRVPSRAAGDRKIWRHAILIVFAMISAYPLLWLVAGSLKPEREIFDGIGLWSNNFSFDNYVNGWNSVDVSFGRFFLNTFIICAIAVIANVISCSMAAYAFASLPFVGKKALFVIMLGTLMLPLQAIVVPQYILFKSLGMLGTILPLVLPKFFAIDAFFIFLLVQFIRGLPHELSEAARVDGAGPIRTFTAIILPLLQPALVTVAIFTFIWTWNDFFSQLIFLTDPESYTVSLGLTLFIDATGVSTYGPLFAMVTLSLVPICVIFLVFQRKLVQGIATSGLKG